MTYLFGRLNARVMMASPGFIGASDRQARSSPGPATWCRVAGNASAGPQFCVCRIDDRIKAGLIKDVTFDAFDSDVPDDPIHASLRTAHHPQHSLQTAVVFSYTVQE
jgi:hypothetical protein